MNTFLCKIQVKRTVIYRGDDLLEFRWHETNDKINGTFFTVIANAYFWKKGAIFIVPKLVTIRTELEVKTCVGGDRIPAINYTHSTYHVRLHTQYICLQEI